MHDRLIGFWAQLGVGQTAGRVTELDAISRFTFFIALVVEAHSWLWRRFDRPIHRIASSMIKKRGGFATVYIKHSTTL
jgi:hypothetical protein